jgi:hypothetical protein
MTTTKTALSIQAKHINELLKELGVDLDLSIEYAHGQPRLDAHNGSHIMSMRASKPNLEATFYAIKNILYEIGRVQRLKLYAEWNI